MPVSGLSRERFNLRRVCVADVNAVATCQLGGIHGLIGPPQHGVRGIIWPGKRGDSEARRDTDLDVTTVERRMPKLVREALRKVRCVFEVRIRREDVELFATDAANQIDLTQSSSRDLREADQYGVPHFVSVRVVDPFEMVQINGNERKRLTIPERPRNLAPKLRSKGPAVGQAGQLVAGGKVVQRVLGGFLGSDITFDRREMRDGAGFISEGNNVQIQPVRPPILGGMTCMLCYTILLTLQRKIFAGRQRSLRPQFFDQAAWELEYHYSILTSYPRLGRGGTLGFASSVIADSWQAAPENNVQNVLREKLSRDWAQSVRKRLRTLYELNHGDPTSLRPITISEEQLCQLAEKPKFEESWWSELFVQFSKAAANERLVFFYQGVKGNQSFVVIREDYINKWYHPTPDDWAAALKRYNLDEID